MVEFNSTNLGCAQCGAVKNCGHSFWKYVGMITAERTQERRFAQGARNLAWIEWKNTAGDFDVRAAMEKLEWRE